MSTSTSNPVPIASFHGTYRFLSNFWLSQVRLPGDPFLYRSVEHAYQAAKTTDLELRTSIRSAPTPADAKRRGRYLSLRPDWDVVKLQVMRDLLRQKFADPKLRSLLLATGDAQLIEGNTWGDTFWGICRGRGKNHLGLLLMEIRAEIRNRCS